MLLWHTDYFELNALEKQQVQENHSHSSFYPWNQEIKFLCGKCPPYTRKKDDILITREGESRPREIYTDSIITLNLLTFLITSLQCTAPNPNPFVLSILHKLIISLSKKYKSFLLWSFLWIFILLGRLPYTHKNVIKMVCFSTMNLS